MVKLGNLFFKKLNQISKKFPFKIIGKFLKFGYLV